MPYFNKTTTAKMLEYDKQVRIAEQRKQLAYLAAIIYAGYSKEQKATHDADGAVHDAWCIIKAANEFGGL